MTNAIALPMPTTVGNLDAYISTTHRLPMLSAQREIELGRRLRDDNDVEAARELVMSHLRLVVSIARGYMGYGLPYADLIQEGNIGLMKAVKRYDPDRGVRLVSFAMHWIKAEIHEFVIKNWRLVKIATTKAQRKLFFNLRSLKVTTDTLSPEDVNAIAAKLGVKPEEVAEMESRFAGGDIALEGPGDGDEHAFSPIDYLPDESSEPSNVLEARDTDRLHGEGLNNALAVLDPRSRRIVEARWLNDDGTATLHDLAAEFSVSAERIRQIEAKALQKMRGLLVSA